MELLISPEIFGRYVTAFFTGKSPGADLERISKISSIEKQRIYLPIQKHTDKVLLLDFDMSPKIADAVITNNRGILLGVQVADCAPVLLYDTKRSVIGTVHAGWRGTASEILKKTIRAICDSFRSDPNDIVVAIGPGIKGCCYHVGYDVFESVVRATDNGNYYTQKDGSYCLDLATANKSQAMSMGIPEKNIWMSDECTYCYPERFYSYRYAQHFQKVHGYAKGHTGRQGGFIGIL